LLSLLERKRGGIKRGGLTPSQNPSPSFKVIQTVGVSKRDEASLTKLIPPLL
jgi:hypothetical protein